MKTAIATVAAVYLAMQLSLAYPLSAGLLAILGVEPTIRKGLTSSLARIGASVTGLIVASMMLLLFGFHLPVLAAFILIAIPLLLKLRLQNGLATCCVVVFHVFAIGEVTLPIVLNELWLLLVGLGTAMVVNMLYMPDTEKRLKQERDKLEQLFAAIFLQIARSLREVDYMWSGSEVLAAHDSVMRGKAEAVKAAEDRLFSGSPYWVAYFRMRDDQLEAIQDMLQIVARVYSSLPHGHLVAELFEALSVDVKSETYQGNVARRLEELNRRFREMPLPQTREEFEVRSAIMQLCHVLNDYLAVAKREKKHSLGV